MEDETIKVTLGEYSPQRLSREFVTECPRTIGRFTLAHGKGRLKQAYVSISHPCLTEVALERNVKPEAMKDDQIIIGLVEQGLSEITGPGGIAAGFSDTLPPANEPDVSKLIA